MVSDSIEAVKSNPYGAKSLSLASQASDTFVGPVLPYAQRPYAYVRPYVAKVDQVADIGLKHFDGHFPVVRKNTKDVQAQARGFFGYPYDVAAATADHVLDVWFKSYKQCDQPGLVSAGKATWSTTFTVTSDFFDWLAQVFTDKKKEAEKKLHEKRNN